MKRKSGTGFWEGGKGTRDQTKMNRHEARKYKGLNKTEAKKGTSGAGK